MSKSENKRAKSRYNSNNRNKDKRNAETNKKKNQTKKGFWKRHRKLALFLKICVVLAILLAIIGAGAVAVKGIEERGTYVGSPVRKIK